jgi:hypothetical protein
LQLCRISRQPHQPGFVLTAGYFGNGFNAYAIGRVHDPMAAWLLASETTIEKIRAPKFPSRPSRMRCCFAWFDEANARLSLNQSPEHCLEFVEVLSPQANWFVGDFALLFARSRLPARVPFLPLNEAIARRYWAGGQPAAPEMLIESDLKVIGVLT